MGRIALRLMIVLACLTGCSKPEEGISEIDFLDSQFFMVNSDSVLVTSNGTYLNIKMDAIVDSLSLKSNSISLEVIEIASVDQLIKSGMGTLTDEGKILSSSGMMKIIIRNNSNQTLYLESEKSIEVFWPKENPDPQMKLFNEEIIEDRMVWASPAPLEIIGANSINEDDEEGIDFDVAIPETNIPETNITAGFFQYLDSIDENMKGYFFEYSGSFINLDKYYDPSNYEPVEMIVNVKGARDYAFVFLTIPNDMVQISLVKTGAAEFSLLGSDKERFDLPIGEKVFIHSKSKKNGILYFGFKEVKIERNMTEVLFLEPLREGQELAIKQ